MKTIYTITPEGAALLFNGTYHNITANHPNFTKLVDALKAGDDTVIESLLDLPKAIAQSFGDEPDFTVQAGLIYYEGKPFPELCSTKALALLGEGNKASSLAKFLRKLRQNPYPEAEECLLRFCVANGLLIDEEGDIIAFKGVRADYKDNHSGTIDNSVGQKPPRKALWQVDRNPNVPCSAGYHVGSMRYAEGYGTRTVIVKVDPRDWVAVPTETETAKGRVCAYEVIAEMDRSNPLPVKEVYSRNDFGLDEDGLDEDEDTYEDEDLDSEF